jgi:hypothetical protein
VKKEKISNPIQVCSSRDNAIAFIPRTKGFHEFSIRIDIQHYKGVERRWKIFSERGKLSTLRDYLIGKLIWEELSSFERELLWIFPGTFQNPIYLEILRFLNRGNKRKELRKYLEILNLYGWISPTKSHFLSLKSQLSFFLVKEETPLQRTKPYSGYTKHYKDHGSLAPERAEIISVSSEEDYLFEGDEILSNFFTLSQEYLDLLRRIRLSLTDDAKKQKQTLILILQNLHLW